MIPKIIHQTWKTKTPPNEFSGFIKQLIELNPEYDYRLWTDEEARKLVATKFPKHLPAYDALPHNIMRADMLRYFIMDAIGGFYLDLDYEVLKPFSSIPSKTELLLPKNRNFPEPSIGGGWQIGNAIFGSARGHIFWNWVLDDFLSDPPLQPKEGENAIDIEIATGPRFLTRIAIHKEVEYLNGVDLSIPEIYHPLPPELWPPEFEPKDRSIHFGYHHCAGSWRPNEPRPSVARRFVSWTKRHFNTQQP